MAILWSLLWPKVNHVGNDALHVNLVIHLVPGLTGVEVPGPPGVGEPFPGPGHGGGGPAAGHVGLHPLRVVRETVRAQVADLHPLVVGHVVVERHPRQW